MGVHNGASLAFDAIHNLLPTHLFHYITFISRFFLTSSPIPTLVLKARQGGCSWGAELGRDWQCGIKSFLLLLGDMREEVGSGKGIHRAVQPLLPARHSPEPPALSAGPRWVPPQCREQS